MLSVQEEGGLFVKYVSKREKVGIEESGRFLLFGYLLGYD